MALYHPDLDVNAGALNSVQNLPYSSAKKILEGDPMLQTANYERSTALPARSVENILEGNLTPQTAQYAFPANSPLTAQSILNNPLATPDYNQTGVNATNIAAINPATFNQNYQQIDPNARLLVSPQESVAVAEEAARRARALDLETYKTVLPEYRKNVQQAALLRAIPQLLIERSQSRTAENIARTQAEVGLANAINTASYWR